MLFRSGLYALAAELGGPGVGDWLKELVEGTDELPLAELLAGVGVKLAWEAASSTPGLGVRTSAEGDFPRLANVYDGGPAQAAGLSAGDVLVALDGLRLTAASLDRLLARRRSGDRVSLHAFRRDELMCFEVELAGALPDTARLTLEDDAEAARLSVRKAWLEG